MFKRNQKARTRIEIIEDEIEESKEMLEYFFLERDIALELDQKETIEHYNQELKAIGRRKITLLKLQEYALELDSGKTYTDIPATIHVRNIS